MLSWLTTGVESCDVMVERIQQTVAEQLGAGTSNLESMGFDAGLELLVYNSYLADVGKAHVRPMNSGMTSLPSWGPAAEGGLPRGSRVPGLSVRRGHVRRSALGDK